MEANVMGWDIGGAHLKAAIIKSPSEVLTVYQQPCELWKGTDKLREACQEILSQSTTLISHHALAMTGELVDLFEGRDDGVKQILEVMKDLLSNCKVMVYAGKDGFCRLDEVLPTHYASIASANWLASATWAAQTVSSGLFVDIGSTTTDILLLNDGKVLAKGYSDYQRLISQELIYTGIVRTAVMAVAQSTQDEGNEVGLMAEYFATMADVYRMTGELNEIYDQTDTADGAEKTIAASAKRLARMVGCDSSDDEQFRWKLVANNLRGQQLERIQSACQHRIVSMESSDKSPLVGAGIGRFLVKQIAQNLDHPYLDFSDLFLRTGNESGLAVADCAPAVAVACLAASWSSVSI